MSGWDTRLARLPSCGWGLVNDADLVITVAFHHSQLRVASSICAVDSLFLGNRHHSNSLILV